VSPGEFQLLLEKTKKAGARSYGEYVRECVLTRRRRRQIEMLPAKQIIELTQAVMQATAALDQAEPGPTQEHALERAIAALDRILP
jgi:hypothetical protein